MSEAPIAAYKPCLNCGGIVPTDSKFCKHCAFNFAESVPPPVEPVPDVNPSPNKKKYLWLVCGLVAVIGVTLAGAFIYKSRRGAVSTATAVSQTMGARAKQIEGKVLRGENLTADDLGGLSAYELRVLRNVHFARYGRAYDRPGLGDYFVTCAWYKPDANYNDNLLTVADKANISLILAQENQVKAAEAAQTAVNPVTTPLSSNPGNAGGGTSPGSNVLSDQQVREILKAAYQRTPVEPTFGYRLDGVSNVAVEILRRGEFNQERKYLPVQARVTADVRQKAVFVPRDKPPTVTCKLTDTADFMLLKNDYGDWQAGKTAQSAVFGKPKLQCGQ